MKYICFKHGKDNMDPEEAASHSRGCSIHIKFLKEDINHLLERKNYHKYLQDKAKEANQLGAESLFGLKVEELDKIIKKIDNNKEALTFMGKLVKELYEYV